MKYILAFLLSLLLLGQIACSNQLTSIKKRFKIEPEMQYIRGGSFMMGSPLTEKGRNNDERQHLVKVKSFWMAKTETTIAQWKACIKDGGCSNKKPYMIDYRGYLDINTPVTNINLKDINEYIRWLNSKTGKRYRLPTEAEWEYAARSGSTTAYPWGDNVITFGKEYNGYQRGQANCQICKGEWAGTSTSPVGSFPAYGGLYDMHGNVLEWTCSAYDKNYKDASELKCAASNDKRPRALRGGTYDSRIEGIRSASRWYEKPSERSGYFGFRLALSKVARMKPCGIRGKGQLHTLVSIGNRHP